MPSPFPGMDPWLEGEVVFPDLHHTLITYTRDAVNAVLPPGYIATTANRVWVDPELQHEPDVALFGRDRSTNCNGGAAVALSGLTAVAQELTSDPPEEPYLEILSAKGKRLVTAFEIIGLPSHDAAGSVSRRRRNCILWRRRSQTRLSSSPTRSTVASARKTPSSKCHE